MGQWQKDWPSSGFLHSADRPALHRLQHLRKIHVPWLPRCQKLIVLERHRANLECFVYLWSVLSLKSVGARRLGLDAYVLEAGHGREDGERFSWPGAPHQTRPKALGELFLVTFLPDESVLPDSLCMPGEDYRGEPTHPNRDVWVIRVETDSLDADRS